MSGAPEERPTLDAVFVYGLLKPGFRLHHIVAPFVRRAAPARARGRLYDARVPAARFDEGGVIEGYLLELDSQRRGEALALLDDVEDEGDVYRRVVIGVQGDGGPAEAYAYEYLGSPQGLRAVGTTWRVP